jgi:aspartate racemase
LLSSRASTPDRSSFILGISKDDPTDAMTEEARRLEAAGAHLLAIPCNTAHYFYESICRAVDIPILNIISETAKFCKYLGVSRIGVLATEGTAASGAYEKYLEEYSVSVVPLTDGEQDAVSRIIFEQIKCGREPDHDSFRSVIRSLRERGAELIVLGCTELSLIKKQFEQPEYIVDSLELLALSAIRTMDKCPIGFDSPLMKFYGALAGKDVN